MIDRVVIISLGKGLNYLSYESIVNCNDDLELTRRVLKSDRVWNALVLTMSMLHLP